LTGGRRGAPTWRAGPPIAGLAAGGGLCLDRRANARCGQTWAGIDIFAYRDEFPAALARLNIHQHRKGSAMPAFKIYSDIAKFDPNTTKYNANNALVLADAARLAYLDEAEARSVAADQWKLANFAFVSSAKTNTQAIVMGDGEFIIVAFRGTQPKVLKDWVSDAKFLFRRQGPVGEVHRGFWDAFDSVRTEVQQQIDRFQDKGQSLWFTGHSLGAALAVLAVAQLRLRHDRPVNGLYTFGQPRVGDADFAAAFNADFGARTFRFVNNNDIVTRVPPRVNGYRDVGRVLYFDSQGNLQDDISWWNRFLDRVKGLEADFGKVGPDNIKDHFGDGYADLLSRNMTVQPDWA
jgi:triacylglycerol lipase